MDDATLDQFDDAGESPADGADETERRPADASSGPTDGEDDATAAGRSDPGEESTGDGGDETTTRDPAAGTPDPATTTYAWAPDGECAVCGTAAAARWRREAGLVCADCVDWES